MRHLTYQTDARYRSRDSTLLTIDQRDTELGQREGHKRLDLRHLRPGLGERAHSRPAAPPKPAERPTVN